MALAAAIVVAGSAVSACGGSAGGSSSGPASGGHLTFSTASLVNCLDPEVSATTGAGIVDRGVFDSLVSMSQDGRIHPWLAQRWSVSPDGKTYTFTLRGDVRFHDGTPLTAEAVKATLDHAVAPATKSELAAGLISGYAGSTVVDQHTVKVRLSRPQSPFLESLSTPYLGIWSPKALAAAGAGAGACERPVGSGPFQFVSWTKSTSVVLKKNPAYNWGPPTAKHAGPARLDGVTFKFVSDDTVRYGALTSGQTDVIDNVPVTSVDALKRSGAQRLLTADVPGAVYSLKYNTGRAPLNDMRVRQALNRSVNLDQLVKTVYAGKERRAWNLLSPATADYDASIENSWPYDPAAASRLLDQAGWTGRDSAGYRTKGGKRLTLRWPVAKRLMSARDDLINQGIQADAKKAGIEIAYTSEDIGAFTRDVLGRNLDIVQSDFRRPSPDVLRYLFASDQTAQSGGGNILRVADPQLDHWLNGAAASNDPGTQKQDYGAAQRYIVQKAFAMPIYVSTELVGVSKKVQGLGFDASADLMFYDAWKNGG
jgi:peptide/nickel transport system substrate-binding protein